MLVGQKIGPFEIEKEIGAGAMGTVYRAKYSKNGQDVAIKIISEGLDSNPNTLARFDREMAILKKLEHQNIVRLYGTGRYHKMPFYIMEYIEGETLEHALERRGRFTWEEVVTLGQQVCAALQHAHEQGIVHRDLKPANVMITPDGTAKLTDFGIAKGLEVTQITATNCTVGTAAYMSPEQCRGERDLTSKSDLYSLGVLFYELLTGKRPFQAETTLDMFLAHTEGKFERPSRIVLDIPIWLDTLVCQMLEKRPDRRPYDAAMVSDSLNRVIEKVTAQRSAGVDAVTETGSHRPRSVTRTDETDLEAARALKASKTRKRLKPQGTPLFQRGWAQVTAICAVLGAVGWITYEAMRPPSAQSLFDKAKRLMESSDADEWAKAREGPIKDYLHYYPAGVDEHSAQVQGWADKVDLEDREKQLRNRMRLKMSPDGEAEQIAQNAVRAEDAGELEAALERWRSLSQKYKESSDLDLHAWGLLGEKRQKDIQAVQEKQPQLRWRIDQARYAGEEFKPSSEPERLAAQATHYEMFEDLGMALRQWQRLKEIFQADLENRPFVILATKKISQLKGSAPTGPEELKTRLVLVSKSLAKAVELAPDNWKEARAICLDIVELYGKAEEPELIGMVGDARKLLANHQATPNEKPRKPPPDR